MNTFEPLDTKVSAYRAYQAGWFGNKPQTWSSLDEMKKSGYTGNLTLRYALLDEKNLTTTTDDL